VEVLDEHHRRLGGQLPVDGVEDGVALGSGVGGRDQGAAAGPGHVPERAEGPGRAQVVADPGEHPGLGPGGLGEGADQGGLADPGLARDQHHRPATPAGPAEGLAQAAELGVPLEQSRPHGHD
jgi:hypothetical protein